tara:strand:- start:1926 stop:3899 length:1974 start_codon:yes stop_codon:yes gene_type:complete
MNENFNKLKGSFNEIVKISSNKLSSTFSNNNESEIYIIISIIVIIFIFFLVISWIYNTLSKKDAACQNLTDKYQGKIHSFKTNTFLNNNFTIKSSAKEFSSETQEISNSNFFDNEYKCLVKNYYIKTAYNACCGDGYKNNFVNECALTKCIELGARCLDFEIYSYQNEPVIAASTANNNNIKETYNVLYFKHIIQKLKNDCFNPATTNCTHDPMFLHFRIMSENKIIYDKMGDYIQEFLSNKIIDKTKYNYKDPNNVDTLMSLNIGNVAIAQKFIIMVNTNHKNTLQTSSLSNYVNIFSGGDKLRLLRYEKLVAAGNNNALIIDDSKRNMMFILPNLDNNLKNFDPLLAFDNGCQFIAMKFQNIDNNLTSYSKLFKDKGGFSFVIKPEGLRNDHRPPAEITPGVTLNSQPTCLHNSQVLTGTNSSPGALENHMEWKNIDTLKSDGTRQGMDAFLDCGGNGQYACNIYSVPNQRLDQLLWPLIQDETNPRHNVRWLNIAPSMANNPVPARRDLLLENEYAKVQWACKTDSMEGLGQNGEINHTTESFNKAQVGYRRDDRDPDPNKAYLPADQTRSVRNPCEPPVCYNIPPPTPQCRKITDPYNRNQEAIYIFCTRDGVETPIMRWGRGEAGQSMDTVLGNCEHAVANNTEYRNLCANL